MGFSGMEGWEEKVHPSRGIVRTVGMVILVLAVLGVLVAYT
jgi:hypothetical protein